VGTVAYNTALPYGRAEVAAASRYVLARRRPGDAVWGNSWEQLYYFRHLGEDLLCAGPPPARSSGRLWLVGIRPPPRGREPLLPTTGPDGWQGAGRREFYRTPVLLLQPPGPATASAPGPVGGELRE